MDRADLLEVNGNVIRSLAEAIAQFAPEAVVISVTDPLDEMTHEMWRVSELDHARVIGMGSTLDSSRFRNELATAAGVAPADVDAITLGSHGAEMVPIVSRASIRGMPLDRHLSGEEVERCVAAAVGGGAAVVALRSVGSASIAPAHATIAPAHATIELLDAIRGALAGPVPAACFLEGQYGVSDIFLGVPAILGRTGVLEVVEWNLAETELHALRGAAASVRGRLIAAVP